MGLLTGFARHWPKGKHIVPATPSLVLLGLSCYAFVSFGTKHMETLPRKMEEDESLTRYLLGERDEVGIELFANLKSNSDVLTDVLSTRANKLPAPARSRLYRLLHKHPAPAVLMTALRELSSPRDDQLESYPSPVESARELLLHNLPSFARNRPSRPRFG